MARYAIPSDKALGVSKPDEFVKRAAFPLLWGLNVHDKSAADKLFLDARPIVVRAAQDDRHFVSKAVNMALRAVGKRNPKPQ
jgi:3-methyladenine DNA glycosylase AlkD